MLKILPGMSEGNPRWYQAIHQSWITLRRRQVLHGQWCPKLFQNRSSPRAKQHLKSRSSKPCLRSKKGKWCHLQAKTLMSLLNLPQPKGAGCLQKDRTHYIPISRIKNGQSLFETGASKADTQRHKDNVNLLKTNAILPLTQLGDAKVAKLPQDFIKALPKWVKPSFLLFQPRRPKKVLIQTPTNSCRRLGTTSLPLGILEIRFQTLSTTKNATSQRLERVEGAWLWNWQQQGWTWLHTKCTVEDFKQSEKW